MLTPGIEVFACLAVELLLNRHQLRVGASLGGLLRLLRPKVAAPFTGISRAHCHVEIDVVCELSKVLGIRVPAVGVHHRLGVVALYP
jgi:hypothetical protein